MDKKDFFVLGKVVKTSGYKGSLVFFFDVDDPSAYHNLEAVFIEIGGELIPFAIRSLQPKTGNTFYADLEDVSGEEAAAALVGHDLLLPLSYLPTLTGNQFYFHEIIGFSVTDACKGHIGIIESVMDQGKQAIFIIGFKGKEILVPVSEEIIQKVNREEKTIYIEAPDGLIDIYL
jgi:16S rRNA processing protein RimM